MENVSREELELSHIEKELEKFRNGIKNWKIRWIKYHGQKKYQKMPYINLI